MTPVEPDTNYALLAELAQRLAAAAAGKEGGDVLQKLLSQIGFVLAGVANAVTDLKGRVDDVAERERSRDMTAQASRAEQGMRFFAQLSEVDRERLVRAVETTAPDASINDFAEHVAKTLDLGGWQVRPLLQAVAYWYDYPPLLEDKEEGVTFVASLLADKYTGDPGLTDLLSKVGAYDPNSTFVQQLKRLLRSRATLGVTAKAEMLANRHERQYTYATVSTDIRPIFSNNIDALPVHAVLLHNLTIGFFEGGTAKKVCIGLSTKDIMDLSGVLNRAWSKDRTLRSQAPYQIVPQI